MVVALFKSNSRKCFLVTSTLLDTGKTLTMILSSRFLGHCRGGSSSIWNELKTEQTIYICQGNAPQLYIKWMASIICISISAGWAKWYWFGDYSLIFCQSWQASPQTIIGIHMLAFCSICFKLKKVDETLYLDNIHSIW